MRGCPFGGECDAAGADGGGGVRGGIQHWDKFTMHQSGHPCRRIQISNFRSTLRRWQVIQSFSSWHSTTVVVVGVGVFVGVGVLVVVVSGSSPTIPIPTTFSFLTKTLTTN